MIGWMPIDSSRYSTNILPEIIVGQWDSSIDLWGTRLKAVQKPTPLDHNQRCCGVLGKSLTITGIHNHSRTRRNPTVFSLKSVTAFFVARSAARTPQALDCHEPPRSDRCIVVSAVAHVSWATPGGST